MRKKIMLALLTFMFLLGASTPGVAARKKSYSSRSSHSYRSYKPKTVRVRGYYRKDGTYVAPHTRSKPTRRVRY
ncbi:MAG: hypothetical protein LBJ98_03565 [Endomicrobium sp.]|jgi:hypothetical protein|nr:hypothetical protein [Endomicrobium sp.]